MKHLRKNRSEIVERDVFCHGTTPLSTLPPLSGIGWSPEQFMSCHTPPAHLTWRQEGEGEACWPIPVPVEPQEYLVKEEFATAFRWRFKQCKKYIRIGGDFVKKNERKYFLNFNVVFLLNYSSLILISSRTHLICHLAILHVIQADRFLLLY
jgi:hypothetical protein